MKNIKLWLLVALTAVTVSATLPAKENTMARTKKPTTTVATKTLTSGAVIQQMDIEQYSATNFGDPDCGDLVAAVTVDAAFVEAHNGEETECGIHTFALLCTGPYAGEWVVSLDGPTNCPQAYVGAILSEPICVDPNDVCSE